MDKFNNDHLDNNHKQSNKPNHADLLTHDPSEYVKVEIVPNCFFYIHITDEKTRDYVVKYFKEEFLKPNTQNKTQPKTN